MSDDVFFVYLGARDQRHKKSANASKLSRRSKFQTYSRPILDELRSSRHYLENASDNECIARIQQLCDQKICGLVLLRKHREINDVIQFMDVPLRAQYDFWTDEMDRPPELVHFSIIDCVAFTYPQMFATTNQQGHRVGGQATICQLSTASSMRLWGKDVTKRNEYATVGKVSDIVARWRHAFPSIRNADDFENVSLCLRLPVPWVVFIVTGKWHAASLPLLFLNERKRSGYHLLSPTLDNEPSNACQMGGAPQSSNIDLAAGQSAADCMRRLCRSQALTEFAKQ